jgi:phosphopantothenoylcysteine decarboxylase/phosphopantothenate--cysteine ligase
MAQAVFHQVDEMDVIILAAAVADYSPAEKSSTKIKKKEGPLKIELERTTDIAATIGKNKKEGQILVGFALETNNAIDNATRKLHKKNFDFIVLNSLEDKGAGFKHDTNKISIIARDNKIKHFELKSKDETAKDIVDHIVHIKSTLK